MRQCNTAGTFNAEVDPQRRRPNTRSLIALSGELRRDEVVEPLPLFLGCVGNVQRGPHLSESGIVLTSQLMSVWDASIRSIASDGKPRFLTPSITAIQNKMGHFLDGAA